MAEPVDRAWAVITDLERVAPCLPGAVLLGVDDDYRGAVTIKGGPVSAQYEGVARFTLILADQDAPLVDIRFGRPRMRPALEAIGVVSGRRFTEAAAGINSIATVAEVKIKAIRDQPLRPHDEANLEAVRLCPSAAAVNVGDRGGDASVPQLREDLDGPPRASCPPVGGPGPPEPARHDLVDLAQDVDERGLGRSALCRSEDA